MKTPYLIIIMFISGACYILFVDLIISPLFLLPLIYSTMFASHNYFTNRRRKEFDGIIQQELNRYGLRISPREGEPRKKRIRGKGLVGFVRRIFGS